MMASVQMPDGSLVDLPDTPSQDQLTRLQQIASPAQPSMFDQFKRQLGLTARAGITGITGTGAVLGDALVGGANAMTGSNLPMPSQAQQDLMTKLGLPQPQGALEKGVNLGASMLAGGMDPALNAVQGSINAAFPHGQPVMSALDKQRQALMEAGYKLPPTEAGGGTIARGLEGVANRTNVASDLAVSNQPITQQLAAKALGLPDTAAGSITGDVLHDQSKALIKEGYDPVRKAGTIVADLPYLKDLFALRQKFQSASFPDDVRVDIMSRIDNIARRHYDAGDAIDKISQLRSNASDQFRKGDSEYGMALRSMANAMENNIQRSLEKQGQPGADMLASFKAARTGLAKNNAVADMLADPSTGTISTVKAFAVGQDRPLTDGLDTIAAAGSPMFRRATGVPTGGKAPALSPVDYVRGLLSTGIGFASGHPILGALLAAAPVARAASRGIVGSTPMQNMMARNLSPAVGTGTMDRIIGGMPSQLLPLFSQGQQ